MPSALDRNKIKNYLENFDLRPLFIEELGWDHGGGDMEVTTTDRSFPLKAVAHKRGMIAYQYVAALDEAFPDHLTRQKIEKAAAKNVREHIIIYASHDKNVQYWQWVKRELGRPDQSRLHIYHRGQQGEALIQKLEHLVFTLDEEDDLTIVDVSGRVRAAFDVEKVTKKFYELFKKEHGALLGFIGGIEALHDREWYASLMLNRIMFIYFIQKRGFLDGDLDYLRNRLDLVREEDGQDGFQSFYRLFLLRLLHEGLSQPPGDRAPDLLKLLGTVPYLNSGLFDVHELERDNHDISIPDKAFQRLFDFFDAYQWHLDDRPLHDDKEISPDILGYIFEKYINQKQMGAYYTKEDITGYISRNTVIPLLFDKVKRECPDAFEVTGEIWYLLSIDPDRYFYEAVRHGITHDFSEKRNLAEKRKLPPNIVAGLDDFSKRSEWNKTAPADYALPNETWREHVARRQRYEEIHAKLAAGEVSSINDLITYNLDIEKFVQDVIAGTSNPELIRAFWKALNKVTILDPTCGSGAFLFAALNILEPVYFACLESMRGFLDDLERSESKLTPETLGEFRRVHERVARHANERYFILKSIILGNLYGVDIMDEAVEICKLRLFLKLIAQCETYEQIEPLPDIDFNIRAGNTLVGFTSLEGCHRAVQANAIHQVPISDIAERAKLADQLLRGFRQTQTEHGIKAKVISDTKSELRNRIDSLLSELNLDLACEYGIQTDNQDAYEQWLISHRPFHWFIEFYEIINDGGFDIVIGNPPYIEYNKIKDHYRVLQYDTTSCGNLYAYIVERSLSITRRNSRVGMTLQLSAICTDRMAPLQQTYLENSSHIWASCYDDRPGKLFQDLEHIRATIILTIKGKNNSQVHTTNLMRWATNTRPHLFDNLKYGSVSAFLISGSFPKCGDNILINILKKVRSQPDSLNSIYSKNSQFIIHYYRSPLYWIRGMDFLPFFKSEGAHRSVHHFKDFGVSQRFEKSVVGAIINSSLFYVWFITYGNGRNVALRDLLTFPIPLSLQNPESARVFDSLFRELMDDYRVNSVIKQRRDGVEYQEFYPGRSKKIIDKIDRELAGHYKFSASDIDYIINYDIKYRVGIDETSP